MVEKTIGVIGLLVCAAMLLRMALEPAQQRRWDLFWRRRVEGLRVAGRWLQRQWRLLRARRGAQDEAARAIGRARGMRPPVDREGNVLRPRSFHKRGSKKPPLH